MKVAKILLVAGLAVAGLANAGTIAGSKHDFTALSGTNGQICVACHAPHGGTTGANGLLWNHALSAVASYTLYSSNTMNGTVAQPSGTSKLCLSCHDGTVAVNSFGGVTGAGTIAAAANLGTDLSNDHPIGITYNTALATADGALFDPATKNVTIGSGSKVKTGTISLVLGPTVECASCHDVHNTFTLPAGTTAGTSGTGATNGLVRVSMFGSALCLTCHDK